MSVWDFIAFGVIIVTAVALILAFTLGKDKSKLDGFYISYRGERVYAYDFNSGNAVALNGDYVEVTEREGGFTLRFDDGKGGYNVIAVDTSAQTVDVTDSNCSTHKDCVSTAKLQYNSSLPIICTPHGLTVSPLTFEDDGNIQI